MSRFRSVAAAKTGYPVARLYPVLGASASGFEVWTKRAPMARAVANVALIEQVRAVHARSRGTYGSSRVQSGLRGTGPVGWKRVARMIREAGPAGGRPRATRQAGRPREFCLVGRDRVIESGG